MPRYTPFVPDRLGVVGARAFVTNYSAFTGGRSPAELEDLRRTAWATLMTDFAIRRGRLIPITFPEDAA